MSEARPLGGASLVAFYGDKPAELDAWIAELTGRLTALCGDDFAPYRPTQVHATLVGLEGLSCDGRIVNRNFADLRERSLEMDLPALAEIVRARLPVTVQLGGFAEGRDYPFRSRGEHPYARSFGRTGSTVTTMGWPVAGDRFPAALDDLRQACRSAGVLHKYHRVDADVDNDFFLVLGHLARAERHPGVVDAMRTTLAKREPLRLTVDEATLSVVLYEDPRLLPERVRALPFDALARRPREILPASLPGREHDAP